MSLATYQRKRRFERTPEPAPDQPKKRPAPRANASLRFVVQKHAARRLHYDFRLELDGVLKSWAVPKGPPLLSGGKSLAVEVEDHPLAYRSFEGTIPEGEYGGGTVLLWDEGRWTPVGDPGRALRDGKLNFRLAGKRLSGEWSLVRMRGRDGDHGGKNWLLINRNEAPTDAKVLDAPSVKSGRTMEQIAGRREAEAPAGRKPRSPRPQRKSASTVARARGGGKEASVAGVRITHPDRVVFPEDGITKLMLAEYYDRVADVMLPHVAGRPLTIVRCPDGRSGKCFVQRHPGAGMPDAIGKVNVGTRAKPEEHLMIPDRAGLLSLIQMGAIEVHTWGGTADRLEEPDRLVFDLDPDPALPFAAVKRAARVVRGRLETMGVRPLLKATGGKGLHVVVPIVPNLAWPQVYEFCRGLATRLSEAHVDLLTVNMRKDARKGLVYLDYLRNARSATAVAPYSARARPGAPVSMPLDWAALARMKRAGAHGLGEILRKGVPAEREWADFERRRVDLSRVGAIG